MDAEPDRRRRPYVAIAAGVLIALVACVCLYVLSYGPYSYMARNDWFDSNTNRSVYRVYWPLTKAMKYCPPFGHSMSWYLSFWVDVPPASAPIAPTVSAS